MLYQELNPVKAGGRGDGENKPLNQPEFRLLWKKNDNDCCLLQVAYIMCQSFLYVLYQVLKQKETFIKCMCREMYISYIFVRIVIEPFVIAKAGCCVLKCCIVYI